MMDLQRERIDALKGTIMDCLDHARHFGLSARELDARLEGILPELREAIPVALRWIGF